MTTASQPCFTPIHPYTRMYGTENRATLPSLSEAQLHKLRQLTLVSLAHQREVRYVYAMTRL